jgi:DNA-binding CsgD family transcriptional regulator
LAAHLLPLWRNPTAERSAVSQTTNTPPPLTAKAAREFARQLARLNRGEHKVIDLTKAKLKERPLAVLGEAATRPAPMPPGADELKALTAAEYVVWAIRTLAANGVRSFSNSELARQMKLSEARVRQLHASALAKLPAVGTAKTPRHQEPSA